MSAKPQFQSTLPVRGATPRAALEMRADDVISIHAPRAGSDIANVVRSEYLAEFQSTLPVRGATLDSPGGDAFAGFQSTLPVRGATCTS